MLIPKILKLALDNNASDIILSGDSKPCLKINGDVQYLDEFDIFSAEELNIEIM
jgi:Tfp pilus assembly pilus retraction ATPase PilT